MMRVLVALSPRMYREATALCIRRNRPDLDVRAVSPEDAPAEVEAFRPHLLVHNDTASIPEGALDGVLCRVEVLYSDPMDTLVRTGGKVSEMRDMSTEELLRAVDFSHTKQSQYNAKPDAPDPVFAEQMQELIGGRWGEMSVMVTYLFQGWNCRGPAKYRDMLLDTATEEIGHVEMLATMVARLLETSPVEAEKAVVLGGLLGGVVGAVLGGGDTQSAIINAAMNPQHAVVAGGAAPRDSQGNAWDAGYTIASGNLLADMRFNVTAESQGRLQVARLYQLTGNAGVRAMFSFLLARDTMHQNQWLAAIEELKADGLEDTPVPSNFSQERERGEVAYKFMSFSEGEESAQGRWAQGPSVDGKGQFEYVGDPQAMGPRMDELDPPVEPRLYSTPKQPMQPSSS